MRTYRPPAATLAEFLRLWDAYHEPENGLRVVGYRVRLEDLVYWVERLRTSASVDAATQRAERDEARHAAILAAVAPMQDERDDARRERDEARRTLTRIAHAMSCQPDDDSDLIEAVKENVRERDEARAQALREAADDPAMAQHAAWRLRALAEQTASHPTTADANPEASSKSPVRRKQP